MIKLIRVKKPKRCQPIITFEKLNALNPSFPSNTFCPRGPDTCIGLQSITTEDRPASVDTTKVNRNYL